MRQPGSAEDVGDLLAGQHEVHGHQHDRGPGSGERQNRVLPAVAGQQRHPVTRCQSVGVQGGSDPVHQCVELGEGQRDIAVDDGHLVRYPSGGATGMSPMV